jgi:TetR/AcrR family transcriptional regulator, transcriptional repressor for nem operon
MPRIVREEEYAVRRNQILEAALRLVYTKGFEQMTIQDILNELQISKGAFYHYFDSKAAVLEALVERIVDDVEPLLSSIVQDSRLSALEKFQRFFDTTARWKTDRKDLMLGLVRMWYADENAVVRQKVFARTLKRVRPLLAEITYQGVREGVFTTSYPDSVCQMYFYFLQGLGEAFVELLLTDEDKQIAMQQAALMVAAYNEALERVLGAPNGSINLIDAETLEAWFPYRETTPVAASEGLTN